MAHFRQQIRERIGTTLTGLDATGSNVFQSRIYNIEADKLPCICIYTLTESSEPVTIGSPRTIQKFLDLVIEVYVKSSTYDATLDATLKEIKEKMFTDRFINNLAKDSFLVAQELNYNGSGDRTTAFGVLTYRVEYHHTEGTLE
tara:strand:- start:1016 stop:1447 length:432 start_codon:yes stop_codon:yes gene_type:complete